MQERGGDTVAAEVWKLLLTLNQGKKQSESRENPVGYQ
jgi:hypothetical protein